MLSDRHSEGNHLLGALFYVVFAHKSVRISKSYVVAISMLGYLLAKILEPKKLRVQIYSCRPSFRFLPEPHLCTHGWRNRGKGLASSLAF
jgi:hypothetical protein